MKKPKRKCKHKKAYSLTGISTNNGITTPWICEICGEEGSDFCPYPEDEYTKIKQKFNPTLTQRRRRQNETNSISR